MDQSPTDHHITPQEVRAVIQRLLAEGTVVAELDATTHTIFPVAISAATGAALRSWVIREQATHTIEIGLGYALSALHICEGLVTHASAAARHVVIDPFQAHRFANVGLQLLRDAGCAAMIEHYAAPSHVVLPSLLSEGRRFDLAFVDGNHRFDSVFVDLYYLGRLVKPGGMIILDDYDLPGIRKAAAFFVANLNWTIEEATPEWAALRTSATPDERHFTYFVDF